MFHEAVTDGCRHFLNFHLVAILNRFSVFSVQSRQHSLKASMFTGKQLSFNTTEGFHIMCFGRNVIAAWIIFTENHFFSQ